MPSADDRPGWMPDPQRPGMLRWWNGLDWSDAYRAPDATTQAARRAEAEARRVSTMTPHQVQQTARQGPSTTGQQVAGTRGTVNTTGRPAARVTPPRTATVAAPVPTSAARARGSLGTAAVVLGLLGLIVGLYGSISIVGLLVSLRALARSRSLAAEGSKRTGIVASLVGVLLSGIGLLIRLPSLVDLVQSLWVQLQQ